MSPSHELTCTVILLLHETVVNELFFNNFSFQRFKLEVLTALAPLPKTYRTFCSDLLKPDTPVYSQLMDNFPSNDKRIPSK